MVTFYHVMLTYSKNVHTYNFPPVQQTHCIVYCTMRNVQEMRVIFTGALLHATGKVMVRTLCHSVFLAYNIHSMTPD